MRYVALLRAINVGGTAKVPMAELRALCGELGWQDVKTYIQSGNIVFDSEERAPALEAALETGLKERFGVERPVIVRSAAQWAELEAANPMRTEAEREPNRVQLLVPKGKVAADAAEKLAGRAQQGERVEAAGGALWMYFPDGVGTSRLTPSAIDKAAGTPCTARNWRTVKKLQEMLTA